MSGADHETSYFVDVLLPIPLERLFTYALTQEEAEVLEQGMRVAVPFGKNKIYTGLAIRVHREPPTVYEAKPLHQLLDNAPVVTPTQLRHWDWMAQYYLCTVGEVFRTAVPSGLFLESETLIVRNDDVNNEGQELTDEEFLVMEALQHQSILRVQEVASLMDRKNVMPLLQKLLRKKCIVLQEEVYERYKPKEINCIRFAPAYREDAALEALLPTLERAPAQSQVVLTYFQMRAQSKKPICTKDLEREAKVSRGAIKALMDKGILEEYPIQMDRVGYTGEQGPTPEIVLNTYQQAALDDIQSHFEEGKVSLLHGITSSGKTEVYFKLMETILEQGKSVLYLLPEIALTTQLVSRLQAHFKDKVAVYHSKYNLHERTEVWTNVLQGASKAQIVIGARSSLFLPFANLGLIVVDEEHETSFKQYDPAPRYHARDAAVVLGQFHGAQVLLGSATPSLESYYNAMAGKYGLAEITRRYGNVLMPEMELVDIKEQHRKKRMKGHFSERLLQELETVLEEGAQAILFQNRRGYAPIVECTTCGHTPQCPNCDVSLTYHQKSNQLRCHYCGHHIPLRDSCMACGNATLDTKGFGTEQIQEELGQLFPNAKVGRMDLDTTRGKHGYEKIISAFEQQEIDILVGTQMLSKGLDFRNVELVGVMNADTLLNFPDFRAHERCFQLLTQVAGRAGRTQKRGKVLIQTYNPYHPILGQVSMHDYAAMYREQLYEREQFKYPPSNKLIRVTLKHRDYQTVNEAAQWFAQGLRQIPLIEVLGPEAPPVARIRNQFIRNIIVKIPKKMGLAQTKNGIKRLEKSFNAIPLFKSIRIIYNVDFF